MAFKIGNSSTSSLLSAAKSAQTQSAALTDAQMAFNWQYSDQGQAAADQYGSYLKSRADTLSSSYSTADHTRAIEFTKKGLDVQKTFRSNQIQQSQQNIMEGTSDPTQKAQLLSKLYDQALQSGDVQNAQSIRSQYDSTIIAIQNAQQAAQAKSEAAGTKATAAANKQVAQTAASYDNTLRAFEQSYKTGKPVMGVDDSGNPYIVKGTITKDANGKLLIQPDPNGKPITIDSQTNDLYKAQLLQAKEGVYQNAIQSGLDDTGTYTTKLSELQNNADYQKLVMGNKLGDQLAGRTSDYSSYDPITGLRSEKSMPISQQSVKTDANGNKIVVNNYKNGVNGNEFISQRRGTETGDPYIGNQLTFTNKGKTEGYYIDQTVPGRPIKINIRKNADGTFDSSSLPYDQWQPGATSNIGKIGDAINSIAKTDIGTYGKTIGGFAKEVSNITGIGKTHAPSPIGSFLGGVNGLITQPIGAAANAINGLIHPSGNGPALQPIPTAQMAPVQRALQPVPGPTRFVPAPTPASQVVNPAPNRYSPPNPSQLLYPKATNDAQVAANIGNATGYKPF